MGLHMKMTIKKEDDIWYYKREGSTVDSVAQVQEEAVTAEDELLKEESDNEDRV